MYSIFVASLTKVHLLGKHLASRGYEKRVEAEVQRGGGVKYSTVASSNHLDRSSWPVNFEAFDSAFLTDLRVYVLALGNLGATFWPFENFDLSSRTRLDEIV